MEIGELEKIGKVYNRLMLLKTYDVLASDTYEVSIESCNNTFKPYCLRLSGSEDVILTENELIEVSELINKIINNKITEILKQIETF